MICNVFFLMNKNDHYLYNNTHHLHRYHEKPDYLSNSVALTVMWLVASHGGDGVVLWGSQNDLKDQRSCSDFKASTTTLHLVYQI